MNDQPNDLSCEDAAVEVRLRRYYEAHRAGPTANELRAHVAARLAADSASSGQRAPLSLPQEIAMLRRRTDTHTAAPTDAHRALNTPRRPHRAASVAATLATAAVIALAAVIFSSLRQALPAPAHLGTTSSISVPNAGGWNGWAPPVPASAWTAVYLDASDRLHAVTPDGQNTAGPALPLAGRIDTTPLATATISPDGRRLAYIQAGYAYTGGKLAILDFSTGTLKVTDVTALQLAWSPDSSTIAAAGRLDSGTVWLVNTASGTGHSITVQVNGAPGGIGRLLSWTDGSHLAAIVSAGAPQADTLSGGPQNLLGVIDVSSGQAHVITTLSTPPDVYVSPDGAVALIAANFWDPTAQLANLRTGTVMPLPNITGAFADQLVNMDNSDYAQGGNYSVHFAWQPDTHTLALSMRASGIGPEGSSGPATQPAGVWLLNLDADTATQITHNTFPLAWSADGKTLLLCSPPPTSAMPTAGAGVGPDLYVLSPAKASGKQHHLASGMAAFLGLAS